MKKWQDLFNTEVTRDFKNRVMAEASKELTDLKSSVAPWFLRWQFVTTMAGVASIFLYFKNQPSSIQQNDLEFVAFEDQDMFDDLDLFEDLELIENINENTGEFDS